MPRPMFFLYTMNPSENISTFVREYETLDAASCAAWMAVHNGNAGAWVTEWDGTPNKLPLVVYEAPTPR